MSKTFWVYDLETMSNCFIACFEKLNGNNRHVFVINRERNDIIPLLIFLKSNVENKDWHLGFNNISFDAQIIEFILDNFSTLEENDSDYISSLLCKYADTIIQRTKNNQFLDYYQNKFRIPVIDIYKMNNWDSAAKRSSLKWIQFSMDWHNVQEMPYHYLDYVTNDDMLNEVIEYCINDVSSTKAIFKHVDNGKKVMIEQIKLRSELSTTYKINLYSASEPKISKEVFLHFLEKKLNIPKKIIKEYRTFRDKVVIKDIILPEIKFDTYQFKAVLNWFNNLVVDTKVIEGDDDKIKGPSYTMNYNNVTTVYALGGLHGCATAGVYTPGIGQTIKSVDVESFYPRMAMLNEWAPAQIDKKQFVEQYEWFFEQRKLHPKGTSLNYLFKIILNATFGLSKSKYSFLYDPEFLFRITINGQLLLSMLYEQIMLGIPTAKAIMQNTDGCEFLIDDKDIPKFDEICKKWEAVTKLKLESDEYSKMIVRDVNNYIAVYKNPKKQPKCKGFFEWENLPLHKNKSFLVVSKAIYEYFINGTQPEKYLASNRNIYDYVGGSKLKGDWLFYSQSVENSTFEEKKLQKLVRYYISNSGIKMIKRHSDGREIQLEAGKWMQTLLNKYEWKLWEDYNIDNRYYLEKIYKEISNIETGSIKPTTQLTLF